MAHKNNSQDADDSSLRKSQDINSKRRGQNRTYVYRVMRRGLLVLCSYAATSD